MDRLGGRFGAHEGEFGESFGAEYDSRAYESRAHDSEDTDPLADGLDIDDDDGFDDDSDDFDLTPPSPVGQDERRMQVRAYNLWASQLGDDTFPSIDRLDPGAMEDFGPYSVLLDFSAGIEDPALCHLGAELAAECSADGAMRRLSDVPARSLLSRITDHYMQILANQAPIGFEAEFLNERGNTALYRGILLPYSSDNETIDFIYGVINWKEMADQATADELLLEIGQALALDTPEEPVDPGETEDSTPVLELDVEFADLSDEDDEEDDAAVLPSPSFGSSDLARPARIKRPALPTPDYAAEAEQSFEADPEETPEDRWSIGETASDYGLAEDWDEPEDEDVEGVVDPLADETAGPGLAGLVTRGMRRANEVVMPSLATAQADEAAPSYPIPHAYEPEPQPEPAFEVAPEPCEPEGLYDCLAEAREFALAARSSEDRSRSALYEAVGRAYDFSLEAEADPEGFAEIVADNGLTVQDRAPMTPVVKLVFGADYDKTRLTEYAAVLSHAHRAKLDRGSLAGFLASAEGGLKGVVREERRLRREEAGKPAIDEPGLRAELAEILRRMDPVAFADLPADGAEFALVMVRRDETGTIHTLGEVPEDIALIERAARKLAA